MFTICKKKKKNPQVWKTRTPNDDGFFLAGTLRKQKKKLNTLRISTEKTIKNWCYTGKLLTKSN